jgi:hypothetical protein
VYFPANDPSSDIIENQSPETAPLLKMENERIASLEQALSELQARDVATQQKLDLLISHITSPKLPDSSSNIETQTPSKPYRTPPGRGPPPALPSEFDGDRSKGLAFLYSCQTYIRLCSDSFSDDQTKITWALSYMKSGRAALWSARVFRWEEDNPDSRKFLDWEDFRLQFKGEFCPAYSDQAAINRLESMSYFQNKRPVDSYLDEFQDLITEAGYTDPKTIVVKFRRGLDPRIQDAIATMASGRPSDIIPAQWYNAARVVDQNRATNEAFRSSYRVPTSIQPHPQPRQAVPGVFRSPPAHAHVNPSPGHPVPMDVDAARRKTSLPITCYRCGEPGHKAPDCKLRFDVRALSVDELQAYLEDRMTALDVVPEQEEVAVEEEKVLPQDFVKSNE